MPRQPVHLPPGNVQVPQAGADTQAISTPSLASPVRSQASQVENADAQAASASPPGNTQVPQAGTDTQAISAPSLRSQAENADAQAVSASPPGSAQADADTQLISTPSPVPPIRSKAPQAENTDAQAVSTSLPASTQASTDAQASSIVPRSSSDNSLEDPNPKGVINLSSKPLTQAQRSILGKGPNFTVNPMHPPNLEYIMAIETACTKLGQQDAEELRAEINRVLRSSHPPKPNLTKSQLQAIRELKRDRDHIVLTADKGVAMVIMDRQDYINKSKHLLNKPTHRAIPRDPTNTIKNKLINILERVKNQTGLKQCNV